MTRPKAGTKTWTDEQEEHMRKHYGQPGWTAATIAEHLGFSRGAVIGKADRMGLCRSAKKPVYVHTEEPPPEPLKNCGWIHGDPRADHSYCQHRPVPGHSFCQEHMTIVYRNWNEHTQAFQESPLRTVSGKPIAEGAGA